LWRFVVENFSATVGPELEIARVTAQTLAAAALQSAMMQAIIVLLVGGDPCLFHSWG
jgi:hypothetical protein